MCNSNYTADGVQFRLLQLDVPQSIFAEPLKIRNRVAYGCFSAGQEATVIQQLLGAPTIQPNLIDALRPNRLTPCDVPLCVLYWTATGGIQFVDLFSARRGLTHPSAASAGSLLRLSDSLAGEHLARVLEFQEHVDTLRRTGALPTARVLDNFDVLPPVGWFPIATMAWPDGANFTTFFDGVTYNAPTFVEGARLEAILRYSQQLLPVTLASRQLIRLYRVRENQLILDTAGPSSARPYMLFITGQAPDFSDAHYDVSYFDYSNYW
jgi:hypothetical protein